ncbi:MAG TPA: hypothetical protein VEJ86_04060 [Candidatus Binataceae bacterium]|nr:hypothetical protein [Candidatus Binataceae bacterium]
MRGSAAAVALGAALALTAAGCATLGLGPAEQPEDATSVQTIEYYPFLVKGYQGSYPARTVLVLMPVDARDFVDTATSDHAPLGADPAIGVTLDQKQAVIQRLYSLPLAPTLQAAIAKSAQEAGMTATVSSQTQYQAGQKMTADYVLAAKITRGWVIKRRGIEEQYGPTWSTDATFALAITVYKPPFSVPFWQGATDSTYDDPPVASFALGPEDETGIYDNPGEVLSVALTRSVAGILDRADFRSLVMQDQIGRR